MSKIHRQFYSGTSGLVLPITQSQYPIEYKGMSRLQYYGSLFNSIEINSIFYKLPRSSTVAKWAESVPENFQFTFKVSKAITHTKNLLFDPREVAEFLSVVKQVGIKQGCLLAQFPPSFKIDRLDRLQWLLEILANGMSDGPWSIAIEFRDSSWYEETEVHEILEEYKATLVIHDMLHSDTPDDRQSGNLKYLRFHGPEPKYRGDYSDAFLEQYAIQINKWLNEGKKVYAYFNNTLGTAFMNLQTLNYYVQELGK